MQERSRRDQKRAPCFRCDQQRPGRQGDAVTDTANPGRRHEPAEAPPQPSRRKSLKQRHHDVRLYLGLPPRTDQPRLRRPMLSSAATRLVNRQFQPTRIRDAKRTPARSANEPGLRGKLASAGEGFRPLKRLRAHESYGDVPIAAGGSCPPRLCLRRWQAAGPKTWALLTAVAVAQTKPVVRIRQRPFSATSCHRLWRPGPNLRDQNDSPRNRDLVANAQKVETRRGLRDSHREEQVSRDPAGRDLRSCRRGSRLESDPILLLAAARPEPGTVLDRSGLPIQL